MDSIVRSEARRLRSKLKEYYESVGKDDPVLIYYRLGSYAPVFRPNRRHDGNDDLKDDGRSEFFIEGWRIRSAVLPFVDASGGELSGACAQIITDELIHEIGRTEGFRVSAASSIAPLVAQALDLPSVPRKLDAQIVFEGTVRIDQPCPTGKIVDPKTEVEEGVVQTSFLGEPWIGSHQIVEQEVRNGCQLHQHLRPLRSGNRGRAKMGSGKSLRTCTRWARATIPPLPR
jgi:hypothetical protein